MESPVVSVESSGSRSSACPDYGDRSDVHVLRVLDDSPESRHELGRQVLVDEPPVERKRGLSREMILLSKLLL